MKHLIIILAALTATFLSLRGTQVINKDDPFLVKIEATLVTGANNGDGLDHDSKLIFNFHPNGTYSPLAIKSFYGNDGEGGTSNEGNTKVFEIPISKSDIGKSQMNDEQTNIVVNIEAVGRDHYTGNLQLKFTFSDDSTEGFDFGDFGIGTFHESNTTGDRKIKF